MIKPSHPLSAIAPSSALPEATIHPAHEEIDRDTISYLVNTWEWPSEKAKKGFISWKLSDVVLLMFPTGDKGRVKLACELLLLGFLMDDWFDHHSFETNSATVARLKALLTYPSTFSPATTIESMHADLFARILDVPVPASCAILETYMDMLACHCDPSRGSEATLGDYLVFREVDVGMPICRELLYWTEDMALTAAEVALLAPLERIANYHVSMINDIFSFEREWKAANTLGQGAVLVNGVRILADEVRVSVGAAKRLSFALARAWEVEFLEAADSIMSELGGEDATRMGRAIKGIERRMTGAEEFSWRTSRYL